MPSPPRHAFLLTISEANDLRMPPLCEALRARRYEPIVVCTDHFPTGVSLSQQDERDGSRFFIDQGQGPVEVLPGDVIWPSLLFPARHLPEDMPAGVRKTAEEECLNALTGFLYAAPCEVINALHHIRHAWPKARQHVVAARIGLTVPRTLITNDPAAARAFVASCEGGAILKAIDRATVRDEQGQYRGMPTTTVDDRVLAHLDSVRLSPLIFQERVERAWELRVTVMGTRVFAAAIDPGHLPLAGVDWRVVGEALYDRWQAWTLPPEVEERLLALHDALGLQIGAADLIVRPDGEHVFLETNPTGQFYWLEMGAPHFPITAALADVLTHQPGARRPMP